MVEPSDLDSGWFTMLARAYLRASTADQDATRAREQIEAFAAERDLRIVGTYVENESGAKLARPELFRLLVDSKPGDILLVEQVDRLSRLSGADWKRLRNELSAREVRVVALDLPTSHQLAGASDEFTGRVLTAINDLMLDILAAVARKDYQRPPQTRGAGTGKGKGQSGRPLQRAARGQCQERPHRPDADGWAVLEPNTGDPGVQPRHRREGRCSHAPRRGGSLTRGLPG